MTLQHQDGDMATVEEMLAFVDSFQWDDELFAQSDITDADIQVATATPADSEAKSMAPAPAGNPPKQTPKHKRIRTGWSSSTGLQRRKRAELEFLRAHVKELEAFVEQLKDTDSRSQLRTLGRDRPNVDCREIALAEFIERKKSEEANRVLKTIVDNQVLVSQTLSQVRREQVTL
ncbi:hypothetical protein PHYPSEUDO_010690 [Phytophthora pseudosyringae]|uniref:Uncharacterized protein n=1 Tax=Phytophthora pseudosyringae TaxID=221518 RepID=A0A8T1VAM3_9STRA|nr:hypothetical protein PHYPSEUDO_010690 [Phytophthora pseudosyringae]